MAHRFLLLTVFILAFGACTGRDHSSASLKGPAKPAPGGLNDFTLLDHEGVSHSLYREADAKAIVIIAHGNGCPIIQKYAQTIRALSEKYRDRGVGFFMINANSQDDRKSIQQQAREYEYGVPILLDTSQVVTRMLGITRTAEAVVIDPRTWLVKFRGAIDDRLSYGADKQTARHEFLGTALDQILAGHEVDVTPDAAKGCAISFFDSKGVTFAKDIAPILRGRCLSCHSSQGKYPPFFDNYEAVKGWSAMIRETLVTERMPPASVDPLYGKFNNSQTLQPEEKSRLVAWIDAGMPRGQGNDPLVGGLKHPPKRALAPKLWDAGMDKPVTIDPKGTLEYLYFQVGGPAPFDMWITATNTTTTNPIQLHHEALMVTPKPLSYFEELAREKRDPRLVGEHPDGDIPLWILSTMRKLGKENESAFSRVGVFGSGRAQPSFFPAGTALAIHKGDYLILEVHYLGNGKADSEKTKIEFYGYKSPGKLKAIHPDLVTQTDYVIPPFTKRYVVNYRPKPINKPIDIIGFLAHMHVRGRAMKLSLSYPEGKEETILSIPNFDFAWHTGADLVPEKPIRVPAGSRLKLVCEFDNSAMNPNNPDPAKTIRFGQTFDRSEMCKMNFWYVNVN